MDTLSRLVPFSRDVFLGLFEQYNDAIWPAQIVASLLGLLAAYAAIRPFAGSGRIIAALLAAAWIWTGVAYHMLYFASINPAAWVFGFVFVVQGLLFLSTGVIRGRLAVRFTGGIAGWCGLILMALAMVFYPLIGAVTDQAWPRIALLGVAPGPTTLFTIGMLLLADPRIPGHLLVIPLLWSFIAGMGAVLLDLPQDLALPLAAVLAIALTIGKNRLSRP
jgi:hypothetical protein